MKIQLLLVVLLLLATVAFPPSSSSSPALYTVVFEEKGLPYGMNWSVTEGGHTYSSTGSIVFNEPNGSYTFTVNPVSGYRANRYSYEVNVTGSNVTETVYWGEIYYPVTFRESGLNPGTPWEVNAANQVISSNSSAITFRVANGSYSYSASPMNTTLSSPDTGSFTVSGSPVIILIHFTIVVNMTFIISGLSGGSEWSVVIDNRTYQSTSPFIYVNIPNGSYSYRVQLPFNYYPSPSSGKVSGNKVVFVQANSYIGWEALIALIVIVDAFLVLRVRRTRRASRKQRQQ
jgi:hypothetical protein